jgi:multiple sugar transport system ATP-binding protein
VSVEQVTKAFGATRVLRGVSLTIAEGEFVSLVGPSGCGKTTLMRIIAGLERADTGSVAIAGRDVTALRAADRDVAMVFQNYALYPHLTAYQNIGVPLVMRQMTSAERLPLVGGLLPGARRKHQTIDKEIRTVAGMLSIDHLLDRKPGQLSGGQRQRVALGRAIVRHPSAFLMDEPLSNLDASLRVQTRKEIVELHRRVGASTVYVTHDQSEAMTMSDRVAVMMDGALLQIATPEEIYLDPQDLRVASFIGSPKINTLAAEVREDGLVRVAGHNTGLVTAWRGPALFAVRPEDMSPGDAPGVTVRVEHMEFLGDSVLLHARVKGTEEPVISRLSSHDRPRLAVGQFLPLRVVAARAFLFGPDGRRVAAGVATGVDARQRLAQG